MPVPDGETFLSESTCVKLNLARILCIFLFLLRKEVRCRYFGSRQEEGAREMHEYTCIAARVLQKRIVNFIFHRRLKIMISKNVIELFSAVLIR